MLFMNPICIDYLAISIPLVFPEMEISLVVLFRDLKGFGSRIVHVSNWFILKYVVAASGFFSFSGK